MFILIKICTLKIVSTARWRRTSLSRTAEERPIRHPSWRRKRTIWPSPTSLSPRQFSPPRYVTLALPSRRYNLYLQLRLQASLHHCFFRHFNPAPPSSLVSLFPPIRPVPAVRILPVCLYCAAAGWSGPQLASRGHVEGSC